jgi:hypothetical protein
MLLNNKFILKWVMGVLVMVLIIYLRPFLGLPVDTLISPQSLEEMFLKSPIKSLLFIIGVPGLLLFWLDKINRKQKNNEMPKKSDIVHKKKKKTKTIKIDSLGNG